MKKPRFIYSISSWNFKNHIFDDEGLSITGLWRVLKSVYIYKLENRANITSIYDVTVLNRVITGYKSHGKGFIAFMRNLYIY